MQSFVLLFLLLTPVWTFASNIETRTVVLCEEILAVGECSEAVPTASFPSSTRYSSFSYYVSKQIVQYQTVLNHAFGDDELLQSSQPTFLAVEKEFQGHSETSEVPHRNNQKSNERHEIAKKTAVTLCKNKMNAYLARKNANVTCALED